MFWFKGAEGVDVMGWAVKPRGWKATDSKASYPLAFIIHGGPEGSWLDEWNLHWNPAVIASQGYFVIAINPTGSAGYGRESMIRIRNEWGGSEYMARKGLTL